METKIGRGEVTSKWDGPTECPYSIEEGIRAADAALLQARRHSNLTSEKDFLEGVLLTLIHLNRCQTQADETMCMKFESEFMTHFNLATEPL